MGKDKGGSFGVADLWHMVRDCMGAGMVWNGHRKAEGDICKWRPFCERIGGDEA